MFDPTNTMNPAALPTDNSAKPPLLPPQKCTIDGSYLVI